jgi:hypothetical protein
MIPTLLGAVTLSNFPAGLMTLRSTHGHIESVVIQEELLHGVPKPAMLGCDPRAMVTAERVLPAPSRRD